MRTSKQLKAILFPLLLCAVWFTGCADTGGGAGTVTDTSSPAQEASARAPQEGISLPQTETYYFPMDGQAYYPDQTVTKALLPPGCTGTFEAQSCAAQGMDRTYLYPDYEISTYPDGEEERILYIFLKTDQVRTAEGADLSMRKEEVEALYGTPSREEANALVYKKGSMRLMFFFDESDALTAIEYHSGITE